MMYLMLFIQHHWHINCILKCEFDCVAMQEC